MKSVKNLGKSVLNGLKDVLGIKSPSKEFMYLGQHLSVLYLVGFENGKRLPAESQEGETV